MPWRCPEGQRLRAIPRAELQGVLEALEAERIRSLPFELVCVYCEGAFRAARSHAETCSGACREARRLALSYEDDSDVPTPAFRRETWSQDRADATGFGLLTRGEAYAADLRVRRLARA